MPEPPTQHTLLTNQHHIMTLQPSSSKLIHTPKTQREHAELVFKFTVTGGGKKKSFMTPHFSFVMSECGHMAKEQQSFKCKFRGEKRRVGGEGCAHTYSQSTCSKARLISSNNFLRTPTPPMSSQLAHSRIKTTTI